MFLFHFYILFLLILFGSPSDFPTRSPELSEKFWNHFPTSFWIRRKRRFHGIPGTRLLLFLLAYSDTVFRAYKHKKHKLPFSHYYLLKNNIMLHFEFRKLRNLHTQPHSRTNVATVRMRRMRTLRMWHKRADQNKWKHITHTKWKMKIGKWQNQNINKFFKID